MSEEKKEQENLEQEKPAVAKTDEQDKEAASPADKEVKPRPKPAAARKRPAAAAKKKEEKPRGPSANQPLLDKYVRVIKEHFADDVIEEAYINWLAKEVPTLVIKNEHWYEVAQFIKHNEQLAFDYLSQLAGIDHEKHMEVYYHFYSFKENQSLAVRVKLDREEAKVASITPLWPGADWSEREAYDLLGINFTGHPNLKRIMLTDDWVGHPLRKDYEPYDEGI